MDGVRIGIVGVCIDDRLDHTRIRAQVVEKLREVCLAADRIILVNEVGGNFGANFRNAIAVFRQLGAEIVFCALLHHDDCAAARAGWRQPLEQGIADIATHLSHEGLNAPLYGGSIFTKTNEVIWLSWLTKVVPGQGTGEGILPLAE